MTPLSLKKDIIGRVEKVALPAFGIKNIYAKVDTGADLSSIWATDIVEKDSLLHFKIFGKASPLYTGEEVVIEKPHYLLTRVTNSFGHSELRYVVKLQLKLKDKLVRATFTLSDRSNKTYPILIGRKLLNRRFLVDVSKGTPLRDIESKRKAELKKEMETFNQWEKKA